MKTIDVVCAVIRRDGKVLCTRRKARGKAYTASLFEFPGGKIEAGETAFEAIEREIAEELEWHVTAREVLATVVHHYPDFTIRLTAVNCDAPADEFTLHDHDDAQWVEPAALGTLQWAAADRKLIDMINFNY